MAILATGQQNLTQQIYAATGSIADTQSALQGLGFSASQAAQLTANLGNAGQQATGGLNQAGQAASNAGQAAGGAAAGLNQAGQAAQNLGNAAGGAAGGGGGGGGGLGSLLGALGGLNPVSIAAGIALNQARQAIQDFIASSVDLATQLDAGTAKIAEYGNISVDAANNIASAVVTMGTNGTQSSAQLVSALGPVSGVLQTMQGDSLNAQSALALMTVAQNDVAVTGENYGTVLKDLALVLRDFGLNTKDASAGNDLLWNTTQTLGSGFDETSQAVLRMSEQLQPLNPSLADATGLMDILGQHGSATSFQIVSLASGINQLLAQNSQFRTSWEQVGVSWTNADGTGKNLDQLLGQMIQVWPTLSQQQQDNIQASAGAGRGWDGMYQILRGGQTPLEAAIAAHEKLGTEQDAASKAAQTLQQDWLHLKSGTEDLATAFGGELIVVALGVADTFVALVAVSGKVEEAIAQVGTKILDFSQTADKFSGVISLLGPGGEVLATVLDAVSGSASALRPEFSAMNTEGEQTIQWAEKSDTSLGQLAGRIQGEVGTALQAAGKDFGSLGTTAQTTGDDFNTFLNKVMASQQPVDAALKNTANALQTATEQVSEHKRSLDLLTQAQIAQVRGETDIVPLLQQEAAAYQAASQASTKAAAQQSIDTAEGIARQIQLAQAIDSAGTKAEAAAKKQQTAYDTAAKDITTAQDAINKALQEGIAGQEAYGETTQQREQDAIAAYNAAKDAFIADEQDIIAAAQAGDQERVKADQDAATAAKSAMSDASAAYKSANDDAQKSADAVRSADDLKRQADDQYVSYVVTLNTKIPQSWQDVLTKSEQPIQALEQESIALQQQIADAWSTGNAALAEQLTSQLHDVQGNLQDAKGSYDELAKAAELAGTIQTDQAKQADDALKHANDDAKAYADAVAAYYKSQDDAATAATNHQIDDTKKMGEAEQQLQKNRESAANTAQSDAESISSAYEKVQEAQGKLIADATNWHEISQINNEDVATTTMLLGNLVKSIENAISAEEQMIQLQQQAVGVQQQQIAVAETAANAQATAYTQEANALQPQIDKLQQVIDLQNLQAAQLAGGYSGAQKQIQDQIDILQLAKDTATANGQSTTDIDSQITKLQAQIAIMNDQVRITTDQSEKLTAQGQTQAATLATEQAQQKVLKDQSDAITATTAVQYGPQLTALQDQSQQLNLQSQQLNLMKSQWQAVASAIDGAGNSAQQAGSAFGSPLQSVPGSGQGPTNLQGDQNSLTQAIESYDKALEKAAADNKKSSQQISDDWNKTMTDIHDSDTKFQDDQTKNANTAIGTWNKAMLAIQTTDANWTISHEAATKKINDENVALAAMMKTTLGPDSSGAFPQAATSAQQSFQQIVDTTQTQMQNVKTTLTNAQGDAQTATAGIGTSIDLGLVQGIQESGAEVVSAGQDLVSELFNAMKAAAGVASPSKVTMDIGSFLGQGLALGMQSQRAGVASAAADLMNAALAPVIGSVAADLPGLEAMNNPHADKGIVARLVQENLQGAFGNLVNGSSGGNSGPDLFALLQQLIDTIQQNGGLPVQLTNPQDVATAVSSGQTQQQVLRPV